jgi:acetyltransferase-like isoleucine patch superfamily enzyme
MSDFTSVDSSIDSLAIIYSHARIRNSVVHAHATVGDFARVDYSCLNEHVRIDRNNHLFHAALGRRSYTGMNTVIMHTEIGAFCSISWGVSIGGANHDFSRMSQHSFLYNEYDKLRPLDTDIPYDRFNSPVTIGNDVWIGAGAVICRGRDGVLIGDGAVIGANAVVTCDVQPYTIVAGNPAKFIKRRFSKEITDILLELNWWSWSDKKISENFNVLSLQPEEEELYKLLGNT